MFPQLGVVAESDEQKDDEAYAGEGENGEHHWVEVLLSSHHCGGREQNSLDDLHICHLVVVLH